MREYVNYWRNNERHCPRAWAGISRSVSNSAVESGAFKPWFEIQTCIRPSEKFSFQPTRRIQRIWSTGTYALDSKAFRFCRAYDKPKVETNVHANLPCPRPSLQNMQIFHANSETRKKKQKSTNSKSCHFIVFKSSDLRSFDCLFLFHSWINETSTRSRYRNIMFAKSLFLLLIATTTTSGVYGIKNCTQLEIFNQQCGDVSLQLFNYKIN